MSQPQIKEQVKMEKSRLLTIKEDSQNNRLKNLLKMLKNINNKTKKLEEKFKPKTVLKATV
jgi:hypothetical protein